MALKQILFFMIGWVPLLSLAVGDFSVEWISPKSDSNDSIIRIISPEKHHLNLNAPFSADAPPPLIFSPFFTDPQNIYFRSKNGSPKLGDELLLSAYLCDDANTYCIKKKVTFKFLTENKTVDSNRFNELTEKKQVLSVKKSNIKKDHHGFFDNDSAGAIELAKKTGKPLLIDFYGIWCPPCNLFDETVFGTQKFKKISEKFVLLKMDADREESWALKSKFKVGGYPTLILANSELVEIDRIVGYMVLESLIERMNLVLAGKRESIEERVSALKGKPEYFSELTRLIDSLTQRKEYAQIFKSVQEGLSIDPGNLFLKTIELRELSRNLDSDSKKAEYKALFDKPSTRELIRKINEQYKVVSADTLIAMEDLVLQASEKADLSQELIWAGVWIDRLKELANPKTLFIDHSEYSIADVDSLKVEWLEKMTEKNKDAAKMQAAYETAISSYKKMIALYKNKDSRAFNLELAYYYRKAGKIAEAKALYERFVKKFPKEFTFHFAEAKLYSELKEYPHALAAAKRAVEFAYGDNLIRSVESLAKIQFESGDAKEALKTIDAYLPKVKTPDPSAQVRTQRYVDQLKKLREKIAATSSKS